MVSKVAGQDLVLSLLPRRLGGLAGEVQRSKEKESMGQVCRQKPSPRDKSPSRSAYTLVDLAGALESGYWQLGTGATPTSSRSTKMEIRRTTRI